MIAAFISFFVVVISFNFFIISYQVNGVNRLVLSAPISLFETAIDMYDINETTGPTFNKETLENNLTSYFGYSIHNFTDDYQLSFYYYNPSDHSMCLNDNCQAVEVTVSAELALSYQYNKTMFYEIRRN